MKKVISILLVLSFCVTLFSCQNTGNEDEDTGDWDYVLPTPVVNADISLPFTSACKSTISNILTYTSF